ncbi:rRNA pseudouridine synthase, partial [Candidatus Saccharibacteria bacterium]|nr:rRNA pseudouridine synthase [Candidatus Saccharibacteria bacterium]
DSLVEQDRVVVNGSRVRVGQDITDLDIDEVDGYKKLDQKAPTILLNKPMGYVCSRDGQGSQTVYDLLPETYRHLKIAGRLDKDSSGLVVLSNNGDLIQKLSHPSKGGQKIYQVELDKPLSKQAEAQVKLGVDIGDSRLSRMIITGKGRAWEVKLSEGRNRQIRRTFDKLGYTVVSLHRTQLAGYNLVEIPLAGWKILTD